MTKAYRITAKLKNNRLWEALNRAFPGVTTQAEFARLCGVSQAAMGDLLNMKDSGKGARGWFKHAVFIASSVGETEEYLFDPALYGRRPAPIEIAMDTPALEAAGLLSLPPSPTAAVEALELHESIERALATLTPQEAGVLHLRFGLDGEPEMRLHEVGARFAYSKERIRQIEAKALRKLRHPSRSRSLNARLSPRLSPIITVDPVRGLVIRNDADPVFDQANPRVRPYQP